MHQSFIIFLALSASALGAVHTYEVKSYPAQGNCHQVARELGAKFEALGYQARGLCKNISAKGFDLLVEYENEKELRVHSTVPLFGGLTSYGAYVDRASCESKLPEWVAQFQSETALDPLVAYCYKEADYYSHTPKSRSWVIRIDALGDPAKRVYADGDLLFGAPVGYTHESFEQTLENNLEKNGYVVALTKLQFRGSLYELTLVYYALPDQRVQTTKTAEFYGRSECLAELKQSDAILSKTSTRGILSVCLDGSLGKSELLAIYGGAELQTQLSAENFKTYTECSAKKPEILNVYQGLGYSLAGGYCTKEGQEYRVRLILN